MRRRKLWSGLLCGALVAGSASAISVSVDGSWSEWFTGGTPTGSPGSFGGHSAGSGGSDTWSGTNVVLPDVGFHVGDDNVGGYNGPAYGGQPYDAEMLMWTTDVTGQYLYVGLVTGFSLYGEASGLGASYPTFGAGDLFFDVDDDDSYEFAIGVASGRSGLLYESAMNGSGAAFDVSELQGPYYPEVDPSHDFSESSPYRATTTGASTPAVDFEWGGYGSDSSGARRYFYEFCINFGAPSALSGSSLGLHWTMECGNDNIDATIPMGTTPLTPVPVPAAAPMVLMGMGTLAFARRFRKTQA